jgi:murein DD-endopeptidase MepM/ murein hydrolase activator NlpD
MRAVMAFFAGFVTGMLFLILLLWRSGSLQPVRAAGGAPTARAVTASAATPRKMKSALAAPEAPQPPPIASAQPSFEAEVPDLLVPVQGVDVSKIIDTFNEGRGERRHQATDIMAPRGTAVVAAADGTIVKLFNSRLGGITIYQFDPTQTWCFYYAHLDRYADGIREGMAVSKGQVIGYVGSTGDASPSAPHLHFEVTKLGPEKKWWKGTAINPYPILVRHAPR